MRYFVFMLLAFVSVRGMAQTDSAKIRFDRLVKEGDVSYSLWKYDEALQQYGAALKLFPNDKALQQKIAVTQQEKQAEPLRRKEEMYQKYMKNGKLAVARKQYDLAETEFRNAIALKPADTAAARYLRESAPFIAETKYRKNMRYADTAFAKKNYDWARTCYKRALDAKPGDTTAIRKIKLAESLIDPELVAHERKYTEMMYLAGSYERNEDHANAEKYYAEALKMKPGDPTASYNLAHVREHLAHEKFEAAIKSGDSLYKAQQWKPARDQYAAAHALVARDSLSAARIADCDEMLAPPLSKKLEKKFNAAMQKGQSALDSGKCDDARKYFDKAVAIKPRHPIARDKKQLAAQCR